LNAFASSRRIAVLAGMERTLPDDLIQIVLGHELAHWLLRHPEKSTRNAWLSGGVLVGAVAGSLGAAADTTARWLGRRPPVSYARNGSALATYPYGREFEREADYVGLYLAARAGVPVVQAEALFQRFAVEHPINTVHSLSHPVTPERLLAVRAAAAEIAARQAAGEPLIPNGWSLPDGHSQRP
jgi:predicted Zn-dependent protease